MANTSATYQLPSPRCLTRVIHKRLRFHEKCLKLLSKGQEVGPLTEKRQDKNSKRTRQKNERGDRKEKSDDNPAIPDWGEREGGKGGEGGRVRLDIPVIRKKLPNKKAKNYILTISKTSAILASLCDGKSFSTETLKNTKIVH